ncbi:hypothetical protein GPK95_18240 [Odoribacter splanchnicus]|nr:hypothetical protein [Odoribacter splanchnicus]
MEVRHVARSGKLWKRWGLIPCHDYGGRWIGMVRRERMARWNGRLESSRNGPFQPPILVYAMDGAQRERGIG